MSGVSEEERRARVVLCVAGEPGLPSLTDMVSREGAVVVLERLLAQARVGGAGVAGDLADRLAEADPEGQLDRAHQRGLRFVVPGDAEWPSGLDDLEHAPQLHDRGGVPLGLWCRGPLRLDQAVERAVAVVGSRSSTSYGEAAATSLAAVIGAEGWTTVSGAAFGIDQAAHRGALAAPAPTVAVLACGADRAYPTAHRRLIDHVAEVGLVVSEAAPGTAPTRIRFLARNRLIAALGSGTVVVEAAVRSGALNTAHWAAGLGRVVMGVPGPVTSAQSEGVHQMLRSRDALLVTRGEEVLEVVAPMGSYLLVEPRGAEQPRDRLDGVQRQVLDAVPLLRPVDLASVARAAGISRTRTAAALTALHRTGFVESHHGLWCQESADDVAR